MPLSKILIILYLSRGRIMNNIKNYAFYITKLRHKLGVSQIAFSKAAGISNSQMRRIEAGTAVLEEQIIKNICETYHVDPRYFEGTVDLDEAVVVEDVEKKRTEIGTRLRQLRQDRKKTLKELSSIIGLSESQLCMIEKGDHNLTKKRAVEIAKALGVGAEWLLTGDERNKEYPVDEDMIEWLKDHPEKRVVIKEWMKSDE